MLFLLIMMDAGARQFPTICHATSPLAFQRILFATDLSEASKQGFAFALELARLMHSDVIVIHAGFGFLSNLSIIRYTVSPSAKSANRLRVLL